MESTVHRTEQGRLTREIFLNCPCGKRVTTWAGHVIDGNIFCEARKAKSLILEDIKDITIILIFSTSMHSRFAGDEH